MSTRNFQVYAGTVAAQMAMGGCPLAVDSAFFADACMGAIWGNNLSCNNTNYCTTGCMQQVGNIVSNCGAPGYQLPPVPSNLQSIWSLWSLNSSTIAQKVAIFKTNMTAAGCPPTITGTAPPTVTVTGTMTLTGISNAASFAANPAAQTAVKAGIAAVVGVDPSFVTVTLTSSRRLERQLQGTGSVKVSYSIVTTGSTAVVSALSASNVATAVQSNIQTQLTAAGVQVTIGPVTVANPQVISTTKLPGGTASGAFQSKTVFKTFILIGFVGCAFLS